MRVRKASGSRCIARRLAPGTQLRGPGGNGPLKALRTGGTAVMINSRSSPQSHSEHRDLSLSLCALGLCGDHHLKGTYRMRKWSVVLCLFATAAFAQNNNSKDPTWWDKYQYILNNGPAASPGATSSVATNGNVDVSNECGPQSETYITINPANPKNLAGGSNEIFRDPMRGYFSTDGGKSWGGVDAPLPPPIGNGIDFGSDPSLAFDSYGNLYYSYIVVFFGNGNGINGTEMGVAKSTDGGKSYGSVTFFDFAGGSDHFNDKPMITTDISPTAPFRDNIYVAWDAAS